MNVTQGSWGRKSALLLGSCLLAAALWLALAATAPADTGDIVAPSDPDNPTVDSGWQAGTCNNEPPAAGGTAAGFCSVATPSQFFEQAAGHPQFGFTQIIVKHETTEIAGLKSETPVGELKTVRVDLPVGLSVNPQATPQCPLANFVANPASCAGSEVGKSLVWGPTLAGVELALPAATVYNLEPKEGEPALFGFELVGNDIFLAADVDWAGDYHEGFTIVVPQAPLPNLILKNRLVFNGRAGNGTFITTPTTCLGPPTTAPWEHVYSTWLRADSYEEPDPDFPNGSTRFESPIPDFTSPKECDEIPFEPDVATDPNTEQTDSPAGATAEVTVPFEVPSAPELLQEKTKQSSAHVKTATVTLPPGLNLNPSAADGLVACTDAQFGKGTRNPVACPPASKIGTVSVQTPPLPADSLAGNVYVGEQRSSDPASGEMFRIFVDAESARYGVSARLIGNTAADPNTGRLSTTFRDNPQVPFSSFRITFDGGPHAALSSPLTCGPNETTSSMIPWSSIQGSVPPGQEGGPNSEPPASPSDQFGLTKAPGGGACPAALGDRPFGPEFLSARSSSQAGAFTTLTTAFGRSDGEQELKGAEVKLPPGLTAKLKGLEYCPEAALAAAAANSGAAESASSSCPPSSLVGSATVLSGTGSQPLSIEGKAFLTGPYNGAPLSLAIVTPATAGPFDLGTVVVRVALFVDPETLQVTAGSDPIPHIFGGVRLDVRSVSLRLDRPDFSVNPTNCDPKTAEATIRGGGANPGDSAAFTSVGRSLPFEVQGCDALDFRPKLSLKLSGAMRRTKNPKLRAVVTARNGDANIRRSVVTLPKAVILDQGSIGNVCTRVQFAAGQCPSNSVYGSARAWTPLLDKPLEGPVILRSSDNPLPGVVAALHGQIDVVLVGRNDSTKGRLRNTFDPVPDAPIEKFELSLRGGRKGLLQNTRNLCPRPHRRHKAKHGRRHRRTLKKRHRRKRAKPMRAAVVFGAQNGKRVKERPKIGRQCRKKHRKRRHRGGRRHHSAR
jgi:hypothetical protein